MATAALVLACARASAAGLCPTGGAAVDLVLAPPTGTSVAVAIVFGTLVTPSCDDASTGLDVGYAFRTACDPSAPASCRLTVDGLRPGLWSHQILVTEGESSGQFQGRRQYLLDRSAGTHALEWPLFRSVHTVSSLADAADCSACLRSAIGDAELGLKPALIQFAPELAGNIVLTERLPPLAVGTVTIDGFDVDGVPHRRSIDGNGLNFAALRIVGAANRVHGLQLSNVGGDSDTLLLEGASANGNLLESLHVIGRAGEVCGGDAVGCVVDGVCVLPTPEAPRGACGDDGIAVRDFAGATSPNVIRNCEVTGALDKGIKVSEGGRALVLRSHIVDNADGGIQATLSGQVTAIENLVRDNRGTNSASGLAANGATVDGLAPARLDTRGNLSIDNALRGISVRSLSIATLRDDFVCGNGTAGRGGGFGLVALDAAERRAVVDASGLAIVHNVDGGVVVGDTSQAALGTMAEPGLNAFAFNGPAAPTSPTNFRNQSAEAVTAVGNMWEHCGATIPCDVAAVRQDDVSAPNVGAPVAVEPALATPQRRAPRITAVEPTYAAAGEWVRLYGEGFDAIDGNGPTATSCAAIASANSCYPVRGNCVFIDRQPAAVVAATPTMLVVEAPFSCVAPVQIQARTRWSRGFGRATFCVQPDPTAAQAR